MKPFTALAAILLAIGALVQLIRFLCNWEVTINGMDVPVWASGIAFLVASVLATMLWRENSRAV